MGGTPNGPSVIVVQRSAASTAAAAAGGAAGAATAATVVPSVKAAPGQRILQTKGGTPLVIVSKGGAVGQVQQAQPGIVTLPAGEMRGGKENNLAILQDRVF